MLETDGICEDVSDWGSDFDEDEVDDGATLKPSESGDLYEVPDGKPVVPIPTVTGSASQTPSPPATISALPNWLRKVEAQHNQVQLPPADENAKPQAAVYIENVLLPTRATKDEDSKNFIETLKRKLSQKNLLVGTNGKTCSIIGNQEAQKPNNPQNKALQKQPDLNNSVDSEVLRKVKESIQKFPWFYRVDRTKAELILENYMVDGSFLVRECHHGGPNIPFTLTIRYGKRLFHIQIRIRPDNNFALGTSKTNEMHFSSVLDMIDTYKKTPLQLHTNGKFFGETKLTNPPIVYSFSK